MIERSCAFEADSFVRVDSSELATIEPFTGKDEHPDAVGCQGPSGAALPPSRADAGDSLSLAKAETPAIAREPSDLLLVAQPRRYQTTEI